MSSPNTPDDKKPTNGDLGPHGASGPGASGQGPGNVVPPWDRGPADQHSSTTHGDTNGREVVAGTRPGPPPRGIVSATGTAAASMSGQQAPVTKLDNPVGETAPDDRFVESPTRNIERNNLPGHDLPNLDAIHHVNDAPPAVASVRSTPTEVGAIRPLRAAVQIRRFDPWATFKIAAVLSVAGFLIWMIAVAVLYMILDGMGVWDQVNSSFGTLVTADGSSSEGDIIGAGTVFGWAALLGVINAILLTALATLGAYIYNLCADMIGGAEVTLADLD
ncbi:DUF3566 domain-containing protein [Gordonia sp. CPCC 206044]|uniref:DUF3566 domain-containing protein n=1 Tax=Gordonia sp. CPCC 206044 TaxID=3140793 RepID=UPI003AF39C17